MPTVKSLVDMHRKYDIKYDGTNVTTTFTAMKPLMEVRYEAGSAVIYNIVERVRDILSSEGVPTGLWATYLSFAEIIARMTFSHKDLTLQKEISGIKAYFTTAYKADTTILNKIVQAVLGTVPPY